MVPRELLFRLRELNGPYLGGLILADSLLSLSFRLDPLLAILLGILLVYASATYLHLKRKYSKMPPGNPLGWDYTLQLLFDTRPGVTPYNILRKLYVKYAGGKNGMFSIRLMGSACVVVSGTDEIRQLLMKDMEEVGPWMPKSFVDLIGRRATIMMEDRQIHKPIRLLWIRFLSPTAIDENNLGIVARVLHRNFSKWAESGRPVRLYDELKLTAVEALSESVLGLEDPAEAAEFDRLFSDFAQGLWLAVPLDLPGFTFHRSLRARREVVRRLRRLLDRFQGELDRKRADPSFQFKYTLMHGFLEHRMPDGQPMDEETLIDNALGLLFGADGTVVSAMATIVQFLHLRPDVLERVRREQREVVSRVGPEFTAAAIHEMKLTEAVVKESLRARTMGNSVMRRALGDLRVGEYLIPKDTLLLLSYELTHCGDRRLRVEGDTDFKHCQITPEAFQPDRWLDPATSPLDFMPFATGRKQCVGQHFAMRTMLLMVAVWARGFKVELTDTSLEWSPFLTPLFKSRCPARVSKI